MLGTTDYRTDPFFELEDGWLTTANGETTHLHDAGSGTPVVLLHGSGTGVSAAANWWRTLPALADRMRVLAPDLIGFGATVTATDTEYGIKEWGAHVVRILDALGVEAAYLVGNSLGGWIALQLAADHPDRVLGVVSMGTGGAPSTAATAAHATPDISLDGMRRGLGSFVTDPSLVPDAMVHARQRVAEFDVSSGRLSDVIGARERDRTAVPLTREVLARVQAPTLLVHGLQDVIIPAARTWALLEDLPSADAVLLNGCGHWSQLERGDVFASLVADFVAGRWRPRTKTATTGRGGGE